jgi:hypothetical protein
VKHHHWRLNGKIVYQFHRFRVGRVCKIAARASTTHSLDILIHPGPIKPKTYAMQGMVGVEVAADGVGMERDKDDIEEL